MSVADPLATRPSAVRSSDPQVGAVERARLHSMLLIRRFEERTAQIYQQPGQKIGGFCHLYSGQEAIAVGIAAIFQKGKDHLINGYRCHGHSLALGMHPRAAMAELLGKSTGCSKGKGGSMHFFDAAVGNHGGHGIVGGHIPVGMGLAFSQSYKNTGGVTFTLFGDGAINQGSFNETFNMASLLKVPAIFIVENNGVAMGTQVERSSAEKDLSKRGSGFNMPHRSIDANDVDVVIKELTEAAERGRRGEGPTFINAVTYRFRGHSMSDPMKYRKGKDGNWLPEVDAAKTRDPIKLYETRLLDKKYVTQEQLLGMHDAVNNEVEEAVEQADKDPHPPLEDRFNDVLAEKYPYQPE